MTKKQKPTEKFETAIIVGPMPFAQKHIKKNWQGKLIFVDGGIIHKSKFKKKAPELSKNFITLGDGDGHESVRLSLKKRSQNFSDLAFCLHRLKKETALKKIILLGFLGGRRDHELFNLGEIALFLKNQKQVIVEFEDQIQFLPKGIHRIHFHGLFSLASLETNQIKVYGHSLYQLKKWTKLAPLSSLGLSNEARGEVIIECKEALMFINSLSSRR